MISSKRDFPVRLTAVCLLFLLLGPQLSLYSYTSAMGSYTYMDDIHRKYGGWAQPGLYSIHVREPTRIEEGLYLGSFGAAMNKTALKSVNVTHVLSFTVGKFPSPYPDDFIYKTIDVFDNPGVKLSHYFNEFFKFIEDARARGDTVLVQCVCGTSRSATVVIAYMMFKYGMSYIDAFTHILERRTVISLDSDFELQLKEFEKSLQGWRDEPYNNISFVSKHFQ